MSYNSGYRLHLDAVDTGILALDPEPMKQIFIGALASF